MKSKTSQESLTIQSQVVMPNDANPIGNLFGGQLLLWMDIVASISAKRHCNGVAVTASVNNVSFNVPILQSSVVTLQSKLSRAFKSSMAGFIDVWVEDNTAQNKVKCNEAIYTFVAIDATTGEKLEVPKLIPETEEEKSRFEGALRRKQLSLILANKMDPKEATELKALFLGEE